MQRLVQIALVVVTPLVGCEPTDLGVPAAPDARSAGMDARTGDGPHSNCTALASYGTPGNLGNPYAETRGTGSSHTEFYNGLLNGDARPDEVEVYLYANAGAFAGGDITPKTIDLSGETQFATCGACVLIRTDLDANGNPVDRYMATGGTLTLTSVAGTISGSISNLKVTHVTVDASYHSTPVGDCNSSIASVSFSAPVVQGT